MNHSKPDSFDRPEPASLKPMSRAEIICWFLTREHEMYCTCHSALPDPVDAETIQGIEALVKMHRASCNFRRIRQIELDRARAEVIAEFAARGISISYQVSPWPEKVSDGS